MAKRKQFFSSAQQDLFQQLERSLEQPPETDLDVGPELQGAINTALRECRSRGLGRPQVVDRMNTLLPEQERPITKRQLDAWTANSKEYSEFPARFLAAFCAATGCDLPLRVLANALRQDLIDLEAMQAKRLGENLLETARLRKERRDLTARNTY